MLKRTYRDFFSALDEIVLYKGNSATVKTDGSAVHTEGNPATCKTDGGTGHAEGNPTTGKTDEGTIHAEGISTKVNPLNDNSPLVNSEGLALKQNLKQAPSSLRVFSSIVKLIKEYRKSNHRRTIVGYIIIAIRDDYVKPESNDSVLINAFYNDFYPDDEKERFFDSINTVLRSYKNGDKPQNKPNENWGKQRKSLFQKVKADIQNASSRNY